VIKTQIVREGKQPVAVVLDYFTYKKMLDIKEDQLDYLSAAKVKLTNTKWTSHDNLKKAIGV